MTKAATPSSSLRTTILLVTPDFDEYAIRMLATTLPPVTVLPKSLRVWVVVLIGTSVPSSGCNERVLVSCSVASIQINSLHLVHKDNQLTCYTLHIAELQCLIGLLSLSTNLLPDVVEVASKRRNNIITSSKFKVLDLIL